ncbi:hypothetical protein [Shewanella sp.]|uniref:hypothetical protein n=1 Tax=Shewanella sp. TaxID=50422 RepID=UPI004047875E
MSVIIKMLRDLEQRQKPETQQSTATPSQSQGEFVRPQVQYYQTEKSRSPLIMAGVCLLLLIPALWFGVSMYQEAEPSLAPAIAEVNTSDTLALSATDNAVDSPAQSITQPQTDVPALEQTSRTASVEAPTDNAVASEAVVNTLGNGAASDTPLTASKDPLNEPEAGAVDSHDNSVVLASNESNATKQTAQIEVAATETPNVVSDSDASVVAVTHNTPAKTSPDNVSNANIGSGQVAAGSAGAANSMTVKEVVLSKTQMAQLQYRKAIEAESAQNVDDAASFYLEAIILQPNLHKARKQLVAIYYAQNNTTTAMRLLESGISMFPQEWEFYVILSRIQTEVKAFDRAGMTLASIPDNSSWARDKWVAQTELAQNTQDFILAEQAYRNLLKSESTQARWWMGLGFALDSQQKYIPAAQAYRSALSYEGLSTSAMNFIETRLAQLGENR